MKKPHWKDAYIKPKDKEWDIPTIIMLSIFVISITIFGCYMYGFPYATVHKYTSEDKYGTIVYYHGEIVWSKFDNIESITPELVDQRRKEAQIITKSLNK